MSRDVNALGEWVGRKTQNVRDVLERRRTVVWLLIIGSVFLVGLLLRCYGISSRGIWWDEAAVWHDALSGHRSPQEAPLNTWMALAIMGLLRRNDSIALHVGPIAFGSLTVLAGYWLGRSIAGPRCGFFAALLIAVSPTLISFSQEARPYALLILLTTLQLGSAIRLSKHWSTRNLCILMFLTLAALSTHLVALPFTLGIGCALFCTLILRMRSHLLDRRQTLRRLGTLVVAGIAAIVLGLAWTLFRPSFSAVMTGHYRFGVLNFLRNVLTECGPSFFSLDHAWGLSDLIAGLYSILLVFGAVTVARRAGPAALACLLIPAVALPAALYLQLGEKSVWPWFRYATPVVVPFLALVAAGIAANPRRLTSLILFGLIFETNLYPNAGLQAWANSAPNTRGYKYIVAANEVANWQKRLSGVIFVRQTSVFGDESDRLSASFANFRKDHLPAFFAGVQDKQLYEMEYRKSVGALMVPVRTNRVVQSLGPGDYAVFYGWDVPRGCSTLSPLLKDPKPPVRATNFVVCRAAGNRP